MSVQHSPWELANQQHLMVSIEHVRGVLRSHIDAAELPPEPKSPAESMLLTLCRLFGLTSFERDLLLMCAGVELDGSFAALVAEAQGNPANLSPTFGLALAAMPNAHWDAISPTRPLRRWRLVELGSGAALTSSPLRISEPVLHTLTGMPMLDERLLRLIEPVAPSDFLVPSHAEIATKISGHWRQHHKGRIPLVQLTGVGFHAARHIAAQAAADLGLTLYAISTTYLPAAPNDVEMLATLWRRDALLTGSALLIEFDDIDHMSEEQQRAAHRFAEQADGLTFLATRERRPLRRSHIVIEVERPLPKEQRTLWHQELAPLHLPLEPMIEQLSAQFNLSANMITQISSETIASNNGSSTVQSITQSVWRACRVQARERLDDLAQRITPTFTLEDLVLPDQQRSVIQDIAAHVRQRVKVYEHWGMGGAQARGLGISALFAGPSGTGKTTAAEALANALDLDLYRIDLSGVVSKYIGETEKNLRRIFDAAEESGALLLFDEADAIFGKRSEVKDSHDRYANIEVGYLLQRMETYRGLVILTTNLKHAIDNAFLRRIRFVTQFPFPDASQRAEIWRRMFPQTVPTDGLVFEQLARLNVAGGNIRTIALNAAFIAADAGEPIRMPHVLRAARVEYAKLEKPLTESEISGWGSPSGTVKTAN
ncbi:ATP-binding protein [Chloroflexia bacterium SDU3-3]|nr:ATP-binding protein [Chloroflexia bacterium SDU3-3]